MKKKNTRAMIFTIIGILLFFLIGGLMTRGI